MVTHNYIHKYPNANKATSLGINPLLTYMNILFAILRLVIILNKYLYSYLCQLKGPSSFSPYL